MRSEIKLTGDGSSTLFVPELNEHYHSINGAVQESDHVFIQAGLNILHAKNVCVLEVGFGTGLNALLTLMRSKNFDSVVYHAIEKYPLKWEQVEELKYEEFLGLTAEVKKDFRKMHMAPWNLPIAIRTNFILHKIGIDLVEYQPSIKFDLIYFDAFAPLVQPELWEEDIFAQLNAALKPDGILVTYCAKGEVRRRLQRAGFAVERLPGPPGKREIMRATRSGM